LAAGPVEGEHQLRSEVLAQRMLGDETFQLGDDVVVAPGREVGVDSPFEHSES
jgi:hypothetical protein